MGAGIVGVMMVGVYVSLIVGEGSNGFGDAAPWASVMVGASVLAFVGAAAKSRRVSRVALLGSTIVFGVIGLIAIFTIGILFIAAAVMSAVAFARLPSVGRPETEDAGGDA